jgi:hypothetical protein
MQPKPPDLGDLFLWALVAIGASEASAKLFAPFVVIFFGWACGMAWAVRNRSADLRVGPFAAATLLTALGVAGPLAALIADNAPDGWQLAPKALLFGLAALLTYHGDMILSGVGRLLPETVRAFLSAKAHTQKPEVHDDR